jgi:hypothetical protein
MRRVPGALLTRLQPHRASLLQAQGVALRRVEARTREALIEAMGRALKAVTATDASGFFRHCGYRATAQLL